MVCRAIRCALLFRLIVKTSCKGRGFRPGAPCRYSWGRSDVRQMVRRMVTAVRPKIKALSTVMMIQLSKTNPVQGLVAVTSTNGVSSVPDV